MTDLIAFSLTPRNLDEAMQYAKLIADSDLAPKDYKGKPGNVLVAIQMGQEVGLKPMQSLQNIAVVNGRPSIWGDAMLALIINHSELADFKEWKDEKGTAHCYIKRRNIEIERTFSIDDAKKAGLWSKQGPWAAYPDRMLQMRARGFALRDSFADVLKGLYLAEESQDIPDTDYTVIETKKSSDINKQLGYSKDSENISLKDLINSISKASDLAELKKVFTKAYKINEGNHEILADLTDIKNKRKLELESFTIEKESKNLSDPTLIVSSQSNEEWIKDFDGKKEDSGEQSQ